MESAYISTTAGVIIPTPAIGSGSVTISTLVDGGRNTSGNFVGSVIGDDKLKIDCKFNTLSPQQFLNLLKIFDRNQGGKFVNTFRVYDPRIGAFRNIKMYAGDRTGTPYMLDENFYPTLFRDVSANIIEV